MSEALWSEIISAISGLAAMALSAYLARWSARRGAGGVSPEEAEQSPRREGDERTPE